VVAVAEAAEAAGNSPKACRAFLMTNEEADPSLFEAHPDTRELEVLEVLGRIEQPLFAALQQEYPEKGWRVCGPASIIVAHILHSSTGIPLGPAHPDKEHLEIVTGFYLPNDESLARDHTDVRYFTGARSEVLRIDPVSAMQWEAVDTKPHISIECHHWTEIATDIEYDSNLYRYGYRRAAHHGIDSWGDGAPTHQEIQKEMVAAMHDSRAFQDRFVAQNGATRDVSAYWGKRLMRAYAAVSAALASNGTL